MPTTLNKWIALGIMRTKQQKTECLHAKDLALLRLVEAIQKKTSEKKKGIKIILTIV
jgi:hypothetical protein